MFIDVVNTLLSPVFYLSLFLGGGGFPCPATDADDDTLTQIHKEGDARLVLLGAAVSVVSVSGGRW